jgi:hypothetical protein
VSLDEVARALGVAPDRRGELHADCPNCGKPAKRGQTHFHVTEKGAFCFVCGYSASLGGLLRRLGATQNCGSLGTRRPARATPPPAPRPWQADPESYVRRYANAPDSVPLWRAYRPLGEGSIAAWQLGVGVLPASKCAHRRLVVPIRREGRVVALAGRAYRCPPACEAAKWTLAGGSEFALFNGDFISEGSTVIVVENRADAILACQSWPDIVTVAKGGGDVWKSEWTARMVAARPELVLFWPDNDEAGMGGAVRGANELLAAGLRADVALWAPTYPPKYDLGSFLGEFLSERASA